MSDNCYIRDDAARRTTVRQRSLYERQFDRMFMRILMNDPVLGALDVETLRLLSVQPGDQR